MGGKTEKIKKLPRVRPGDAITAETYNRMAQAIEDAFRAINDNRDTFKRGYDRITVLDEDVDTTATQAAGHTTTFLGVGTAATFKERTHEKVKPIQDYSSGLFFSGEYVPTRWNKSGGKHMILPGVRVHVGVVTTEIPIEGGGAGKVTIWEQAAGGAFSASTTFTGIDAYGWGNTADPIQVGERVFLFQHPKSREWVAWPNDVAASVTCTSFTQYDADMSGRPYQILVYNNQTDEDDPASPNPSPDLACGWENICQLYPDLTEDSGGEIITRDASGDECGWKDACEVHSQYDADIHGRPQQVLVYNNQTDEDASPSPSPSPDLACGWENICQLYPDLAESSGGQVLTRDASNVDCGWKDIEDVIDLCSVTANMADLASLDTSTRVFAQDPSAIDCGWVDICHILTNLDGYDVTKKQALIHDQGNCEWIDISTC